jgi:hypothetical protein
MVRWEEIGAGREWGDVLCLRRGAYGGLAVVMVVGREDVGRGAGRICRFGVRGSGRGDWTEVGCARWCWGCGWDNSL